MAEQFLSQIQSLQMQQVLAPHLRQSLEFLQVPVLELRTLIQQELQQNPALVDPALPQSESLEVEPGTSDIERELNSEFEQEFEVLARLDEDWNESFRQNRELVTHTQDDENRRNFFLDSITESVSLQEHLLDQLVLTDLTVQERKIGELLIGSINDDGYLSGTLAEMAAAIGEKEERLLYVLGVIHDFDPVGVGARDLKECLLIQMRRLGKLPGDREYELVRNHLHLLGTRKFKEIASSMQITEEEVLEIAHYLSTLEPKPGRRFSSEQTEYVVPEIIVRKVDGEYVVHQEDEFLPRIRISRHYRRLMEDPDTPQDVRSYIREKVRAAQQLVKGIESRQKTVYRIACEIVRVQQGFFEQGPSQLKPLIMSEVAEVLGVHETTVSRAVANKYMQTPRGTFEMKYFFTTGIRQADGQAISNESIKDALAEVIGSENPAKPYSDAALVKKLAERNIKVARRTIAKYREQMHILPSHLRKQC